MVEGAELLRAYYYTAFRTKAVHQPLERAGYAVRHRSLTVIRHIPRSEVRAGKLAFRGLAKDGKPAFQQERVDLMLGVGMALLASKDRIPKAAL